MDSEISEDQQFSNRLARARLVAGLSRPALATIPHDAPWQLLTDRERDIITQRMNGETLRAIGVELRISTNRVRQIEQRALHILHRRLGYARRQANRDKGGEDDTLPKLP